MLWDPNRQDDGFFHQSVNLHATYYYIQIQIHRPFLTKGSPLSFSSLAMCTNAARSCTHILEAAMPRRIRELPNLIVRCLAFHVSDKDLIFSLDCRVHIRNCHCIESLGKSAIGFHRWPRQRDSKFPEVCCRTGELWTKVRLRFTLWHCPRNWTMRRWHCAGRLA